MNKIIVAVMMTVCLFSSTTFASEHYDCEYYDCEDYDSGYYAPEYYDFEDTMMVGYMWRAPGENNSYEISPASKAGVIMHNGEEWVQMAEIGDVEIIAHSADNSTYRALIHITRDEVNNRSRVYTTAPPEEERSQFASEVLRLVNIERAKVGAAPLRLTRELLDAADIRARELPISYSHTRPNGQPCQSLIRDGKYTVGENIAAGSSTPEEVVKLWMNSSGHRANILNKDYNELGVGYAFAENSEYKHYWVQLFKRPMPKPRRW